MSRVLFDFTIFQADGVTPLFGSADSDGDIIESDFQTHDLDFPHDRPYLKVPENFVATRLNVLQGSSEIGGLSVGVLDKRLTTTDQTTGIVTSVVQGTVGHKVVLRRWREDLSEWQVIFKGAIHSFNPDTSELLTYWFQLRDLSEYERDDSLFASNETYVLFGEDLGQGGQRGPADNYGALPGGGYLLPGVGPFLSIFETINHFRRYNEATPADGIYFGFTNTGDIPDLVDYGYPTEGAGGLFYYTGFAIRWRPKASGDPWIYLRAMPVASNVHANPHDFSSIIAGTAAAGRYPSLYFGSFDEAEVPEDDQEIEFQVLSTVVSETTPFFWDRGTLGDLLIEIRDGLHTTVAPIEEYDDAGLYAFALATVPARFILTAPVKNRKKWVADNIYKASIHAPALTAEQRILPRFWGPPDNETVVPTLEAATVIPIGEYEHSSDTSIGRITYTYIREYLDPPATRTERQKVKRRFWFDGEKTVQVVDDDRADWQRLKEAPITLTHINQIAPPNAKDVAYAPVTIRDISDVDGRPSGGDAQDEVGHQLATRTFQVVDSRFGLGAPTYTATCQATPSNLDLLLGDFVRVPVAWLPNYDTDKRGMDVLMQIVGISQPDPAHLVFYLQASGVTYPDAADIDPCCAQLYYPFPDGLEPDFNFDMMDRESWSKDGSDELVLWTDESGEYTAEPFALAPLVVEDGMGECPVLRFTQGSGHALQLSRELGEFLMQPNPNSTTIPSVTVIAVFRKRAGAAGTRQSFFGIYNLWDDSSENGRTFLELSTDGGHRPQGRASRISNGTLTVSGVSGVTPVADGHEGVLAMRADPGDARLVTSLLDGVVVDDSSPSLMVAGNYLLSTCSGSSCRAQLPVTGCGNCGCVTSEPGVPCPPGGCDGLLGRGLTAHCDVDNTCCVLPLIGAAASGASHALQYFAHMDLMQIFGYRRQLSDADHAALSENRRDRWAIDSFTPDPTTEALCEGVLPPPTITSTEAQDDGRIKITIDAADWPAICQ